MQKLDALVPAMPSAYAGAALSWAANANRQRTALIEGSRAVTYAEIEQRTNRIARALLHLGLTPGEHVAVLMGNSIESVEVPFACEKAALPFVPLNVRHTFQEHVDTLEHADAVAIIVGPEFLELGAELREAVPRLRSALCIGAAGHAHDLIDLDELSDGVADTTPVRVEIQSSHVVRLAYTSGTTGKPKGVVYDHARWYQRLFSHFASMEYALDPSDTMIHVGPLTHAAGIHLLPCFLRGARNVVHKGFDAVAVLDDIERYRATQIMLGPTMLTRLVEEQRRQARDTTSLKRIHYGTSPTSPQLISDAVGLFGPILRQQYGLTEAVQPLAILYPHQLDEAIRDGRDDVVASCGHVSLTQAIKICDDDGNELPPGEVGEIALAMQGSSAVKFWKPGSVEAAAQKDGWFHTGDLGILTDENLLTIVGRKKDMVISGGFNVYAIEVENALASHPAVSQVAVVGTPDPEWGEVVTACIVLAEGTSSSDAALAEHAGRTIAGYKKPRKFVYMSDLPHNVNGKVAKETLKSRIAQADKESDSE